MVEGSWKKPPAEEKDFVSPACEDAEEKDGPDPEDDPAKNSGHASCLIRNSPHPSIVVVSGYAVTE
jgi:hypothetical protein